MIRFQKTKLSNGIRVMTENHSDSNAVSIGIWVTKGSRDESDELAGISHFLEHMVFKGTKTKSAFQIAQSLEALGGELNAYTTREYTCFHALVLKDHWEVALDVCADLVSNMKYKPADFKLEKGVILQEIAMGEESHEEAIYDYFFEKVYSGHPLGRPISGSIKSVTQMSSTDIKRFYQKEYNGSQLIISAAGRIDHDQFVRAIEKKLKNKKSIGSDSHRRAPRWKTNFSLIEKQTEQCHLLLGLPTIGYRHSLRFDAYIVNAILGGGMTSRLFQSVREKKGLVYSIHSQLNTYVDCGQLFVYAASEAENIQQVAEIVLKELKKMKAKGLSEKEIEMFKTQVIGQIMLGSDDVDNRMTSIAVNEMVFKQYRPVEQVIAEIKKIDKKSIRQYLNEHFPIEQLSGVMLGQNVEEKHLKWWSEFNG